MVEFRHVSSESVAIQTGGHSIVAIHGRLKPDVLDTTIESVAAPVIANAANAYSRQVFSRSDT